MKASTKFYAILAILLVAQIIHAHVTADEVSNKPEVEEIYLDENKPISGMFFSTEYVVEEYECDDMFCLLYDDADANLFNTEIYVDQTTYESVIESIKSGKEMVGSLVLSEELSSDEVHVFTFVQDENF